MATNKSYLNDELDPVANWERVETIFDKEVGALGDSIKKNAKIDLAANKANSSIIKQTQKKLSSAKILIVVTSIVLFCLVIGMILGATMLNTMIVAILCGIGIIGAIALLIVMLVKKKTHKNAVDSYIQIGYEQMKEVNADINSSTMTDMISAACSPWLELTPFLSGRDETLWKNFISLDSKQCCYSHLTGTLAKSPLLIMRVKSYEMIMQTYSASKTVYTGSGQDRRPNIVTVTYVHPAPLFTQNNTVFFLSNAAPDLSFSANKSFFHKNKNPNMENSAFNKVFNVNRDNETQFRLLFTILAQENIVKLYDQFPGYFFEKNKKLNIVKNTKNINENINTNSNNFAHYDYEMFFTQLQDKSKEIFKTIYFLVSPILCIPVYQHFPSKITPSVKKCPEISNEQIQTVLQNYFNKKNIVNSRSTTDHIICSKITSFKKDITVAEITTNSFVGLPKIAYVQNTAVKYIDYQPVHKTTNLLIIANSTKIVEKKASPEQLVELQKVDENILGACVVQNHLYFLFSGKVNSTPISTKKYIQIMG